MNPFAARTSEFRPQLDDEETQPATTTATFPHIPKPKFVPYPSGPPPPVASTSTSGQCSTKEEAKKNSTKALLTADTLSPTVGINAKPSYKSKRVFKVIIIGDAGVGKTCLSFRFCNGRFPHHTEATIGVDFRERSLILDNELIRVQLWDTAGQERYRQSIVAHYYRNVNAVVFVYDVTNPASFRSLNSWIQECQKHAVSLPIEPDNPPPHILIGNKCDLITSSTRVRTDQAQIFADENDMAHFETSALADSEADHVESIFMTLVHKLRHSKAMHVQTMQERSEKDQKRLLLKANETGKLGDGDEGWCC